LNISYITIGTTCIVLCSLKTKINRFLITLISCRIFNIYLFNFKFVRVIYLVGRYFYNMYIVNSLKLCFPYLSRTTLYFHVYIILDFPITYRNDAVLCQSECACLHKTVNMAVFFVKSNENTYPKRESTHVNHDV